MIQTLLILQSGTCHENSRDSSGENAIYKVTWESIKKNCWNTSNRDTLARLSLSELIGEICLATSLNTENDQLCSTIEK